MLSFLETISYPNQPLDGHSDNHAEQAVETLRQDGLFGGKNSRTKPVGKADGSVTDASTPLQSNDTANTLQLNIPTRDISFAEQDFDRLGADLSYTSMLDLHRFSGAGGGTYEIAVGVKSE